MRSIPDGLNGEALKQLARALHRAAKLTIRLLAFFFLLLGFRRKDVTGVIAE